MKAPHRFSTGSPRVSGERPRPTWLGTVQLPRWDARGRQGQNRVTPAIVIVVS